MRKNVLDTFVTDFETAINIPDLPTTSRLRDAPQTSEDNNLNRKL